MLLQSLANYLISFSSKWALFVVINQELMHDTHAVR